MSKYPEWLPMCDYHVWDSAQQVMAKEIFKELDKGIIPYEKFGRIIPASDNSAYAQLKRDLEVE
jgi:hypothetical protein